MAYYWLMPLKNLKIIVWKIMDFVQVIIWLHQLWVLWQNLSLYLCIELIMAYISLEKGILYGTSYISKRYSQANDKYLKFSEWKQ